MKGDESDAGGYDHKTDWANNVCTDGPHQGPCDICKGKVPLNMAKYAEVPQDGSISSRKYLITRKWQKCLAIHASGGKAHEVHLSELDGIEKFDSPRGATTTVCALERAKQHSQRKKKANGAAGSLARPPERSASTLKNLGKSFGRSGKSVSIALAKVVPVVDGAEVFKFNHEDIFSDPRCEDIFWHDGFLQS